MTVQTIPSPSGGRRAGEATGRRRSGFARSSPGLGMNDWGESRVCAPTAPGLGVGNAKGARLLGEKPGADTTVSSAAASIEGAPGCWAGHGEVENTCRLHGPELRVRRPLPAANCLCFWSATLLGTPAKVPGTRVNFTAFGALSLLFCPSPERAADWKWWQRCLRVESMAPGRTDRRRWVRGEKKRHVEKHHGQTALVSPALRASRPSCTA